MLRFQLDQLAEEGIVLRVGDLRAVELVILPVVMLDLAAERLDPLLGLLQGLHRDQSFTIGARLTARILTPTVSNLTISSSSVRVSVLLRTRPRPQLRCSTLSP